MISIVSLTTRPKQAVRRRGELAPRNNASNNQSMSKAQVRQMIRGYVTGQQEIKYFGSTVNSTTSNAITLTDLTLVPQGDTGTSRDGDNITLKGLDIIIATTVGDTTNMVRYVAFFWHVDSTAEVPTIGDVLLANAVYSPILPLKPSKFSVVFDELVATDTAEAIRVFRKKISFNKKIEFIPGVNTGLGHLYLMAVSDSVAVTHPGYQMYAAITFADS